MATRRRRRRSASRRSACSSLQLSVRPILSAAVALVFLTAATAAKSEGEHTRRLTAEIAVMAGDARQLAEPGISDLHSQGLLARLRGALAPLYLLVRRARQERPALADLPPSTLDNLHVALDKGDLDVLLAGLRELAQQEPHENTRRHIQNWADEL